MFDIPIYRLIYRTYTSSIFHQNVPELSVSPSTQYLYSGKSVFAILLAISSLHGGSVSDNMPCNFKTCLFQIVRLASSPMSRVIDWSDPDIYTSEDSHNYINQYVCVLRWTIEILWKKTTRNFCSAQWVYISKIRNFQLHPPLIGLHDSCNSKCSASKCSAKVLR
jgi:hypothetical protein